MPNFMSGRVLCLQVFPWLVQREKENRDWHDSEVDDETAYRDRNGAQSSEQVTENGRTHERHCRRGTRRALPTLH